MVTVIQFPTPSLLLQEIVGAGGKGVITAWLAKHPGARAKFRIRVQKLSQVPRVDWNKKQFRYLDGGVAELKWDCEKKEFRALGFDYKGYFVMVLGCIHKGKIYDPANWLDTAKTRKAETERGQWSIRGYQP